MTNRLPPTIFIYFDVRITQLMQNKNYNLHTTKVLPVSISLITFSNTKKYDPFNKKELIR